MSSFNVGGGNFDPSAFFYQQPIAAQKAVEKIDPTIQADLKGGKVTDEQIGSLLMQVGQKAIGNTKNLTGEAKTIDDNYNRTKKVNSPDDLHTFLSAAFK